MFWFIIFAIFDFEPTLLFTHSEKQAEEWMRRLTIRYVEKGNERLGDPTDDDELEEIQGMSLQQLDEHVRDLEAVLKDTEQEGRELSRELDTVYQVDYVTLFLPNARITPGRSTIVAYSVDGQEPIICVFNEDWDARVQAKHALQVYMKLSYPGLDLSGLATSPDKPLLSWAELNETYSEYMRETPERYSLCICAKRVSPTGNSLTLLGYTSGTYSVTE